MVYKIIFLFCLICIFSCKPDRSDIIGKWFVSEYLEEKDKTMKFLPGSYIEFLENGHLVFQVNGYTQNGKWEFDKSTSQIVLKPWKSPVLKAKCHIIGSSLTLDAVDHQYFYQMTLQRTQPPF